jgi:hypothetical protein
VTPDERDRILAESAQRTIQRAKQVPPDERDLLETLLAADIPFERAISLVADEGARGARSAMAQYAGIIREHWVPKHPEGSEVRRQFEALADLLDPAIVIGTS